MKNVYHRLLLVIAGSTQEELASQIRHLKIENEILRSKLPSRVCVTDKERNKMVKLGNTLGELVTIVHPDTLRRWIRETNKTRKKKESTKKGRPPTKKEIREMIIKLARENDWGYARIMGELKKLGVTPPSRNTVKNILKENGLEPGPKRGAGTQREASESTRQAAGFGRNQAACGSNSKRESKLGIRPNSRRVGEFG